MTSEYDSQSLSKYTSRQLLHELMIRIEKQPKNIDNIFSNYCGTIWNDLYSADCYIRKIQLDYGFLF